ncbi:unnamed protein product [Urochloa decumbens]|uniref:C2 NT-type domain-containing protein n=1 Tax=Urochloa decumbens TaxID=240449 RepID=A0ABC9E067_9POAL
MADDEKSKNQILQALVALSHTLYQARAPARRTSSLAFLHSADGNDYAAGADVVPAEAPRPLSRRLSLMSPFRSKDDDEDDDGDDALLKRHSFTAVTPSWKPICTLPHIGMQSVGCLFCVEVVAAQGLPPSMNGLLLAVAVRRKETRGGAVRTMPARVQNGAADFNETLYVRCHLYCSGGGGTGKPLKFEPLPFLLSVVAVHAPQLDLGQSSLDFSAFVKEFTDKCQKGVYPRQRDVTFPLAGWAKGSDLVVKLAFQIVEGLGLVVNSQLDATEKATNTSWSSSFARKISKSSFIIMSPKKLRSKLSVTPKMVISMPDLKDIDNFKLDEPVPTAKVEAVVAEQKELQHKLEEVMVEQVKEMVEPEPAVVKEEEEEEEEEEENPKHVLEPEEAKEEDEQKELEPETEAKDKKFDDLEMLEFDVVDKGVEGQEGAETKKALETTVLGAVSESEPEMQDERSVDLELLEFNMVDRGIEGQDEAETEKALEAMLFGAMSDAGSASDSDPEMEDEKSIDLEMLEFNVVDKGIEGQEEAETEKAPEATVLGAVSDMASASEREPEMQDEKSIDLELLEFNVVDRGIEGQDEAKAEKALEAMLFGAVSDEGSTSEPDLEMEDEKSVDLEVLEFNVVDKGVVGQDEAEAKKALEAMMLGVVPDATTESVEQLETNMEEVTGESQHPPRANKKEVTGESLQSLEANGEEVTGEQPLEANGEQPTEDSLQPSKANWKEVTRETLQSLETNGEQVTEESLQLPEAVRWEVTKESLQTLEANREEVARESLQLSKTNKEVTKLSWKPLETNREEVTGESLQPSKTNKEEVTGDSLQYPNANVEEVTGESLQLPEADKKEVTREAALQPPEAHKKEVKSVAAKSSPRKIRWHTLAIIVAPVAIIVGKALARQKQWLNLGLELRCHVVSQPNQSPHHHYVQHLWQCDMQCSVPDR